MKLETAVPAVFHFTHYPGILPGYSRPSPVDVRHQRRIHDFTTYSITTILPFPSPLNINHHLTHVQNVSPISPQTHPPPHHPPPLLPPSLNLPSNPGASKATRRRTSRVRAPPTRCLRLLRFPTTSRAITIINC